MSDLDDAANYNEFVEQYRLGRLTDFSPGGSVTKAAIQATGLAASDIGAAPVLTPTATAKTAPYTAAAGDLALMNVSGGGTTLTLPTAPANKTQVAYRAMGATAAVPMTIARGGTDTIGSTGATTATIPLDGESGVLQYDAANTRWLAVSNVKPLTTLDARFGLSNVFPSGDTTGATDSAAIAAMLAATGRCTAIGGQFFLNDSIGMPSNSTLRLREAELIRVASGSINQCNVITTDQVKALGNAGGAIATSNTNIRIIGDGKSKIYVQNPAGVTRANTRLWNYIGVLMVRVDGLVIEGVDVGPTQAFGVCLQGVTKARVRKVNLSQDATTTNQDGIDIGPGCQDVTVEQITGASGDDVFSLFGHSTAVSMHPAVNATNLTGTAADILDITYRNCSVFPGINFFRFNCGDGRAVHRITVENCGSTKNLVGGYNAFIQIGEVQYTTTPATVQNFSGIMVRNVRPGMRLLNLDQNVAGVHISGVSYEGNQSPQIIGKSSVGSNLSTAVSCQDITVENLTMGDPASAVTVSACVILPVNTVTRMTLRNWSVNRIKGLLDNGATITGLKIRNIEIGVLGQPTGGVGWLVNSTVAETGSMDGVTVDTYAGVFSGLYVGSAVVKLKLGPNMPVVTSQDTAITTASATTKGSTITVDNTKQPDGGAGSTAATWIANGTTWIKQTDLGAMVGR